MKTYLTVILSLCLAALPLSAKVFEGKARIKVTEGKGRAVEMDYSMKEGFVRTDIQTEGHSGTMIIDFAKKEMITLMPDQPMYMVMSLSDVMDKAVGKEADVKLEKTSATEKILGYDCVKYLLKMKDGVSELWITEALGAFMSMPNSGGKKPGAASSWQTALQGMNFFPMRVLTKGKNGGEQSRFEVVSIEPKKLDATLFAPPAGYQRLDMNAMRGMMGGLPGMTGNR